jgi:hypothetical protein
MKIRRRELTDIIGDFPCRMAFAGGWIDQPFVSKLDPRPPGSMVVAGLEPTVRFMDRYGMATGTRKVALRMRGGDIPDRDPAQLVRELYAGAMYSGGGGGYLYVVSETPVPGSFGVKVKV